jgi:membrane protease YdiL (CAAX protease family)
VQPDPTKPPILPPRTAKGTTSRRPLLIVLACWAGILAITAATLLLHALPEPPAPTTTEAIDAGADTPPTDPRLTLPEELVGRITLAITRVVAPDERERLFALAGAPGAPGSGADARRQLAGAILAAEAIGPEAGLDRLPSVARIPAADPDLRAALAHVEQALSAAAHGETVPPASEATAAALRRALGWYGSTVLLLEEAPDSPARRAFEAGLPVVLGTLIGAVAWFGLLGLAGTGLLIALVVLVATGRLRPQVLPADRGGRFGHVYAETFLLWLVLFVGLQLAAETIGGGPNLLRSGVLMVASLSALAWPLLRGVSAEAMRRDLGLWWGRSIVMPPLAGLATYAICLPLLVGGVLLSMLLAVVLQALGTPPQPPSHPLQDELASGGGTHWVALFVLAAVIVPPIEEIMFRGVLYRHLREWWGRLGSVAGIAAAALASSLLFAAIHPQGIAFVPILGALAVGFCIARELGGSVAAASIAHGINNGAVVLLNVGLLSG